MTVRSGLDVSHITSHDVRQGTYRDVFMLPAESLSTIPLDIIQDFASLSSRPNNADSIKELAGQALYGTWTPRVRANKHYADEALFTSAPLTPLQEISQAYIQNSEIQPNQARVQPTLEIQPLNSPENTLQDFFTQLYSHNPLSHGHQHQFFSQTLRSFLISSSTSKLYCL